MRAADGAPPPDPVPGAQAAPRPTNFAILSYEYFQRRFGGNPAILGHPLKKWPELGIPITMTDLKFMRFIAKEIFPGGSVPGEENIVELSAEAGFTLAHKQYLNRDYVRTLDTWAQALEAHHDEAVAATSDEVYQRYMKYLTGCSDFFARGISELGQFTLVKA